MMKFYFVVFSLKIDFASLYLHRAGAAGQGPGAGVQAAAYPGHEEHGAGLWAVEGGGGCVGSHGVEIPCERASNALRKVVARPESFCT